VAEERRFNPRLGGNIGEADFVGYMDNLRLPHPKLIDIAVPANLRCGRPDADTTLPSDPGWAALTFTFAGIWEIEPSALEEATAGVQIVDVREPDEYDGSLGHIRGATLLPLGELSARSGELAHERPVVTVCRSGARSAQATILLQQAGFGNVANLAGGMLRWRAEGHPVEGGRL
jgi:rhodanese-related sulfurtransferase